MRILQADKHMASFTGHVFTVFDGAGKTTGSGLFGAPEERPYTRQQPPEETGLFTCFQLFQAGVYIICSG